MQTVYNQRDKIVIAKNKVTQLKLSIPPVIPQPSFSTNLMLTEWLSSPLFVKLLTKNLCRVQFFRKPEPDLAVSGWIEALRVSNYVKKATKAWNLIVVRLFERLQGVSFAVRDCQQVFGGFLPKATRTPTFSPRKP